MRLGDHEVLRLIAKGGMGAVHEVRHVKTGMRYAAKTVLAVKDERARGRFRREAELLARVDRHPGIVKIHTFGETPDGGLYMILDLVEGEDLDQVLKREGRLEARRAAAIARDVARALGAAHALGVVHRDVKPSNVFLDREGRPRLGDFGLAAARDLERLTKTGTFVGTVAYSSPEQARSQPCVPPSDVFSLGCVLFHALAGTPPIAAESAVEHMRVLSNDRPLGDVRVLAPGTPAALAAILGTCLEKDPVRRPPDGAALAADLDAFLEGRPVPGRRRRSSRVGLLAGVALACAVAALALAGRTAHDPRAAARSAIETLGVVSRASLGASDAAALLAAQAAIELGRETTLEVPSGTTLVAAQAALGCGAHSLAARLASSALDAAPAPAAPAREELLLVRAQARLASSDAAGALADAGTLRSPGALRLRARILLAERRFPELAQLEEGEPSANAARAVALAIGGKKPFDVARVELGRRQDPELLALLAEAEALAALSAIGEKAEDFQSFISDAVVMGAARVSALQRAAIQLDTAADAPRWLDRTAILRAVDRTLAVIERAPVAFSPATGHPGDVGEHWNVLEKLTRDFERVAVKLAPAPDALEALSPRLRTLRILGVLERGDRPEDDERFKVLEAWLDRAPAELVGRLRHAVAFRRELKLLRGEGEPRELLEFVTATIPSIPETERSWDDQSQRVALEILAANLAIRSLDERAPSGRMLDASRAWMESARTHAPSPAQWSALARLRIVHALAEGDVPTAARTLPDLMAGEAPGAERFLRAEVRRLQGDHAAAREQFALASTPAFELASGWFILDLELARVLADLERGDPDAKERLARVWRRRGAHVRALPWIEKATRRAIGE